MPASKVDKCVGPNRTHSSHARHIIEMIVSQHLLAPNGYVLESFTSTITMAYNGREMQKEGIKKQARSNKQHSTPKAVNMFTYHLQ